MQNNSLNRNLLKIQMTEYKPNKERLLEFKNKFIAKEKISKKKPIILYLKAR